jgi:small subunit ribosomal protein S16
MATTIRLARHGAKKHPFYRIVVADSRAPRNGRRLEQIGTYDPTKKPSAIKIEEDKLAAWLGRGARPSLTVAQLLRRSRLATAGNAAMPASDSPTPDSAEVNHEGTGPTPGPISG